MPSMRRLRIPCSMPMFVNLFYTQVLLDRPLDLSRVDQQFVYGNPTAVALIVALFTADSFHQGQVFGEFWQIVFLELFGTVRFDQVIVLGSFGVVGLLAVHCTGAVPGVGPECRAWHPQS